MDEIIAQFIKQARLRKNWTQIKLANEMKVTGTYINKLEKGESLPSIIFSKELAKKLEINERNFVLRVYRERAPADIKDYFLVLDKTYSEGIIGEDEKELLELYDELDSRGKKEIKRLASLLKDYIYRKK